MEVWIKTFIQDFDQFVDGSGQDVVHHLLQTGLGEGVSGEEVREEARGVTWTFYISGSNTNTFVLSLARDFSSRLVCLYTRVLYLN